MLDFVTANWPALALAIALILISLFLLLRGGGKQARERHRAPDALDEGAAPARRNQALIDAPSAATLAKAGGVGVLEREPERVAEPPPAPPPPPPSPPPPPTPPPAVEAKPAPAPKPTAAPKAKAPPPPPKKPSAKPKAKAEPKPKPAPAPKPRAAPKPKAAPPPPAPEPAPAPPPSPPQLAPVQATGDLARIKGLGPKLQSLLPTLGVATVADIAAWSEADIDRIDAQLGTFAGRIRKDNWVEQAKLLVAGDIAGFEAKFGKL